MALDFEDDILHDFMVEAGEILEQLQGQLVELEQDPDDQELLNAIFRGFHTVKGGAGFLGLTPMVDTCHGAENLFDLLRNQQLQVTAELMDLVLTALDEVNGMFSLLQQQQEPSGSNDELLQLLAQACAGNVNAAAIATAAAPKPLQLEPCQVAAPTVVMAEAVPVLPFTDSADLTLAALTATPSEPQSTVVASSSQSSAGFAIDQLDNQAYQQMLDCIVEAQSNNDHISEDEFESLLDQLHGKGKFGEVTVATPPLVAAAPTQSSALTDDEIGDDEFEALLDELHGKGQFSVNDDQQQISENEFEALLDQLHGVGKGPSHSGFPQPLPPSQPALARGAVAVATPAVDAALAASTVSTSAVLSAAAAAAEVALEQEVVADPVGALQAAVVVAEQIAAASANAYADSTPVAVSDNSAAPATSKRVAGSVQGDSTVRVDTARLDEIMNMVGELVLVRNRLLTLGIEREDEEMSKALANLDVVTADLQSGVMKTRMQPIKKVFGRFPRVVRDLARNLDKQVQLLMEGEDTDLDKNLVEALADPLVHLVRNAVDHGIELPAIRQQAGKDRQGTIILSASQEGDHIRLRIVDDGAGMDAAKLKQIAIDRGVLDVDAANRMSDKEAYALIFAPGFSTKTEISDISGRGVGMDVVKTRITQLNGSVDIDSYPGRGTTIDIKVPLTLAIMPTLMVNVAGQVFALPLSLVAEIFHMDLRKTNLVDGQLSITVREKAIPLFYLDQWLRPQQARAQRQGFGHVVMVQVGLTLVGLVVDGLIGQEEVVIKPLGALLQGVPGMAGSTITSNGGIALILDLPGLINHYAGRR
ncbi:chemotaxis protein CheA [Ferrimonas senticii]|uniref:chemotaxis protein CheA n=1 Tax=Ferrimonas senticii TaxID=394566 RepID=UPI00040ADF46|nr:chemotaxis protein CheA [Ferrimonas senticii]